jgi:hypothetical protein
MTERLIHLLESIEIEPECRQRALLAPRKLDESYGGAKATTTIEKAGQGIETDRIHVSLSTHYLPRAVPADQWVEGK